MLGLFAVLIVLQGAFRKWWLPGLSTPLYIAKDVALTGALALFGLQRSFQLPSPLKKTALPAVWGGLALIVIAQSFNPNFPSVIGSAVGVRSYLLYSMLLVLMPVAMEYIQRPKRWIMFIALVVIVPVLILGIYQYNQPIDAWINQYVSDDQQLASVEGNPRITGTFSYLGGMASFLSLSLFFGLAALIAGFLYSQAILQVHRGWNPWFSALIVAPMNGSRSVVLRCVGSTSICIVCNV